MLRDDDIVVMVVVGHILQLAQGQIQNRGGVIRRVKVLARVASSPALLLLTSARSRAAVVFAAATTWCKHSRLCSHVAGDVRAHFLCDLLVVLEIFPMHRLQLFHRERLCYL